MGGIIGAAGSRITAPPPGKTSMMGGTTRFGKLINLTAKLIVPWESPAGFPNVIALVMIKLQPILFPEFTMLKPDVVIGMALIL